MNNFEMNKNRRKRNSEDILCTWKFFQYFLLKFTKNNHFKGQNGADWVGSFFTKQPWHLCTCTLYTNVRSISAKTLKYITVVGLKFHLAFMYKNRHVVHALMCASPCIQFYFGAGKSLRDNFPKEPYFQGFVFICL